MGMLAAAVGDKIKVRKGPRSGARGAVKAIRGEQFVVLLETSGEELRIPAKSVTNLSLAARKAWLSMPKRQVGRPKGTRFSDRVSVTLRIDRNLWRQFQANENSGLIDERTAVINTWIGEKLAQMTAKPKEALCPPD
jgi:hypothetical protein